MVPVHIWAIRLTSVDGLDPVNPVARREVLNNREQGHRKAEQDHAPRQHRKVGARPKRLREQEKHEEISHQPQQLQPRQKRIRGPMKQKLQQADSDEPQQRPVQNIPLDFLTRASTRYERPIQKQQRRSALQNRLGPHLHGPKRQHAEREQSAYPAAQHLHRDEVSSPAPVETSEGISDTSAIHAVPLSLLSKSRLGYRTTRTSRKCVSGPVAISSFTAVQGCVPVTLSLTTLTASLWFGSLIANRIPLSVVISSVRIDA